MAATTHLGVAPTQVVVLESIGVQNTGNIMQDIAFFRIDPANGHLFPTSGTKGFTAPAGNGLMITEVDWQYEGGLPNGYAILRVFLTWPNPAPRGLQRRVFESPLTTNADGSGAASTSCTSGIYVPPGVYISVDIIGTGAQGTGKLQHALMRGYLIKPMITIFPVTFKKAGKKK